MERKTTVCKTTKYNVCKSNRQQHVAPDSTQTMCYMKYDLFPQT